MKPTYQDIGKIMAVDFSKIYLDPNNPRIAPDLGSRYQEPDAIFDDERQKTLAKRFYDAYHASELEEAIVAQGWIPLDPIIVWEHPDRPGHYIVVEGNTRISVLRNIRVSRLEREQKKLERFKNSGKTPLGDINQQQHIVDQLEGIIRDTKQLSVYPVVADTIEDLEKKLPILLGVRHVSHSMPWSPYATNLYITSLYERLFRARHGEDEILRFDQDLIVRVGDMVSYKQTKTRRAIQAASAFDHFKRNYEDMLPDEEEFVDGDHYFFELILQHPYTQERFEFTKDQLYLPDESEKALFEWAFSKPRSKGKEDDNQNIFFKAENIRLWNQMARYDTENATAFAAQFDVSAPEKAMKSMRIVEAEFLHHKARQTPLNTLQSLLEALKELKGETLVTQAEFLEPTLQEIVVLSERYLRMMRADAAE